MHSILFISAILKGKWLVDPLFAISQGSIIASILNNNIQFEHPKEKPEMKALETQGIFGVYHHWKKGFSDAPRNSVAIIPVIGPLMKEDMFCGPMGMASMGKIIKEAEKSENIDAILLHIDSPGGTVDGTETLAAIIKECQKPVVSFVDGQMTSAALWIGSSADEIISSTDTDMVGSVGVLMSFADVQPYWEKKGVKFHTLTASTSPEKVKVWEDLREGKYDGYIKEVLDPLDEKFMATIRGNRPKVEDRHLTGKVFFARDVMGVFVDSIGTIENAIARASELAKENGRTNQVVEHMEMVVDEMIAETTATETEIPISLGTDNKQTSIINMKQYKHVNAALGVESLESVDEVVSLNDEQLEALDTKLGSDTSAEIQSKLDAANETIGAHETTISGHVAAIAAKDAEIARLKGKAVEENTVKPIGGDDTDLGGKKAKTVVKDEMDFAEQVNAVADEYLAKHQ